MAKTKKKGNKFAIFMVVYAVLGLIGISLGLKWLWGFISAYEASRPHIAIEAYMESLTPESMVEQGGGVLEQVDENLQDPDACRAHLLEAVSGPITYARKASACTEDKQVYVLKTGKQVIGSFSIVTGLSDKYGFTPWVFHDAEFDLSYLMNDEVSRITIPADCGVTVQVNGIELDETYIVESETMEFELLEDFYGKYDAPMFTVNIYEFGPFLGEQPEILVLDAEGEPFVYDESFDPNSLILLNDAAFKQELTAFTNDFLKAYIVFAGCANDQRYANYYNVSAYIVPGSNLAKRMKEALDGLQYAQSMGDVLDTVTVHHLVELNQETYMCDVTYLVNTTGRQGVVQTTNNAKIIVVLRDGKLLVDSMIAY